MLGLLLIFYVGKAFFNLAKKHDRNQWVFAILGIVVYYGITFIFGIGVALFSELSGSGSMLGMPSLALQFIAIPVGLLGVWLFHYILRKNWEGNPKNQNPDLLDNSDF